MPRRLVQLFAGLVLYGISDSMLLLAGLGVDPWDVLHQGLARRTGVPVGTWAIIVGAVVLLLWIPLRQRPGLGTVSNVVVLGSALDAVLAVLPAAHALLLRAVYLVIGIGCSFTRHGIATPVLPPGKKIIHATNDTRDLHKAFAADLGLLGDAHGLKAVFETIAVLPVLALGLTLAGASLVTAIWLIWLGALLFVISALGWFRNVLPHEAHEDVAVAEELFSFVNQSIS